MQENINTDDHFSLIELDLPGQKPGQSLPNAPEAFPIDMLDTKAPACTRCAKVTTVDADGICEECLAAAHAAPATSMHGADTGRADKGVAAIKAQAKKVREAAAATEAAAKAASLQALAENQAALQSELTTQVEAAPVVDRRERLLAGSVVAGAAAEGHGALTSWSGEHALTVTRAGEIASAGGIDQKHHLTVRKPETYAHAAIKDAAKRLGYYATKQKRDKLAADQDFDHRWRLQPMAITGDAGDSTGRIVLVVTLKGAIISFDMAPGSAPSFAAEEIERTYNDLLGAQVLTAGQITGWLGTYLRDQLGAVKYYRDWYIPQATRPQADRVIAAFAGSGWGKKEEWHYPMTPMATSNQLASGIAAGLLAEVQELYNDQEHDANATTEKTLGERGARSYLQRYKNKLARVKAFELILGEDLVKSVKAVIGEKVATLEASLAGCDDGMGISQRFAMVWDEVEYDFAKAAKKAAEEEVAS